MRKLPDLLGRTLADLTAERGPPDTEESFRMDDPIHEFRIELYNTYPPGTSDARIEERTWLLPDHNETVWFHSIDGKWISFETLVWSPDSEF